MTLEKFDSLSYRDFANGAVLDEIAAALKNREELLEACRTVEPWVMLAMARDPYITHPTSLIHAENDLKLLRKAIKNAEGTP